MSQIKLLSQLRFTPDPVTGMCGFYCANNADWRDAITFYQAAPNAAIPVDITTIDFFLAMRSSAGVQLLNASTVNGQLINRGNTGVLELAIPYASTLPDAPGMGLLKPQGNCVVDILAKADGLLINLMQVYGSAPATVRAGVGVPQ